MHENLIIVGAGLSGLTLAYLLSMNNRNVTVLEATSRLGGRIQTVKGNLETPLELGATWFSDQHPNLLGLIHELQLEKFTQFSKGMSLFETKSFEPPQKFFVPEAEEPSYRLVGGTQVLIDTLSSKLNSGNIRLNTKVTAVKAIDDMIEVACSNGELLKGDKVIICLPPQLTGQIEFSPELPLSLTTILPTVQTWMAGAIKFVLEYDAPFWRNNGYSGMLFSHAGIVTEMYDHTDFEENKFGFTGFLNGGAASYSLVVRKENVLKQLEKLLGKEILNPISYHEKIWNDQFIQSDPQNILRPHQNNGHPVLQQNYMNNKLFFAGTETSIKHPGYMEGAVISAKNIFEYFSKQ